MSLAERHLFPSRLFSNEVGLFWTRHRLDLTGLSERCKYPRISALMIRKKGKGKKEKKDKKDGGRGEGPTATS